MAWAFVTGQAANSGATWWGGTVTDATLSLPGLVGNGNFVVGHVQFDTSFQATPTSIVDDKGNVYRMGLTVVFTGDGQSDTIFWKENLTNAPQTITVAWASNAGYFQIQAAEYSGILTSGDPKDVQEGRYQNNPGTGANAVSSSASGTNTQYANDLVIGICAADQQTDTNIAAGTGFTRRGQGLNDATHVANCIEDKDSGAINTATRATWTAGTGTKHYVTTMTAFQAAGGGGGGSVLRRGASLSGLGASGPFFHDPLSRA
jgi:hypothetical protein